MKFMYLSRNLNIKFDPKQEDESKDEVKDKTLSENIDEAAKKVEEKLEKNENEEKPEEKDEEESEESSEEEDELSEEEQIHAKNLFKLLKNPTTQKQALETLVKAAGIDTESTKKDEKAAKKAIKDVLAEKLPNYKFLAAELGDALESILNEVIEDKTKDIKATLAQEAVEREKVKVETAQEKVFAEYKEVPNAVLVEMDRILKDKELIPGEKMSPERFIRVLVNTAAENKNVTLTKLSAKSTKIEEKTNRNRTDAMSRLASVRVTSEEGKKVTQVKTMDEAINEAARLVEEKMGVS